NIPEEHLQMVLAVDCPTMLLPFTRQIISQASIDGGFIPFLLEPMNFLGMYENAKKQEQEKKN
nr:protein-export chaperone SecB [Bacteroidales bacterium]